jgi:ABC-type Co2+ transport system permease subunit
MSEINSGMPTIQMLIYLLVFLLLAFSVWGVYRAYKKKQFLQGVSLSLGAAIGALAGMFLQNVGLGIAIGIAIGFAVGAGFSQIRK